MAHLSYTKALADPTHVQFKFFMYSAMVVGPVCPTGATCIGSYVDPASHQRILLVGGPKLTAFRTKSGVAYNMSTYYFTYGGGTANAVLHDDSTLASAEDYIFEIWDDTQQQLDTILNLCSNVAGDLLDDVLFQAVSSGINLIKTISNRASTSPLELVYGKFKTVSLLIDSALEGSGLESVWIGPAAELTIPPTDDSTTAKFIKYSKLGLTISNFGASALANVIAKARKADQPTIKRWKGTIAAVVAVPTICALFEFGKQLGFAAAAWDNEIESIVIFNFVEKYE
ncbi:hypothetical protein J3F83DRAFT_715540 [Trichoderma novae-zelandiae]